MTARPDSPLCKRCRHALPADEFLPGLLIPLLWPLVLRDRWRFAKCGRNGLGREPVVGPYGTRVRARYCITERSVDSLCGPDGRHFEAREGRGG